MIERLNPVLYVIGVLLGVVQIIFGFYRYFVDGIVPALFVSLAVVAAGPVEDILKRIVRHQQQLPPEEPAVRLVDLATSIAFLLGLLIALRLM